MNHTAIVSCLSLALAGLLCATGDAGANVIMVDWSGGGDHETIQEGLDAAAEGDTVRVAPGTYSGTGNVALSFGSKNLVLEAENGLPSVTIDCGGADRAVYMHNTSQDTSTVIRGFVIQNAYTDNYNGGAMRLDGVSIIVEDCIIKDCSASHNGGGIYISYTGMGHGTRVRNCVFQGNSATYRAGALMVDHASAAIGKCLFLDNWTTTGGEDFYGGGAMHLNWVDTPNMRCDVSRCTFVGNSSGGRGAAIMGWNSVVWTFLTQCVVAFHEDDALAVDSYPLIDGLTFFVMYGNMGGDIDAGYSTILVGDPLFCDYYSDDFTLCEDSPALPANNIWSLLMGYAGEGCGAPCSSPVERTSWGRIKAMYR